MTGENTVILQQPDTNGVIRWIRYEKPLTVIQTHNLADVLEGLKEIERAVDAGHTAAGFISYDAAPAFDPALVTRAPGAIPLLWFGIYELPEEVVLSKPSITLQLDWKPSISPPEFEKAIYKIKQYIAAGDTYQVNYSFRLQTPFTGDARDLFRAMHYAQRGNLSAYIETEAFAICSASPELFFACNGDQIICRLMKGTSARGLYTEDDEKRADALKASPKNQAENIMIVDMLRNDLGRIAETGSIQASRLFELERYSTLWQMTSTVEARSRASLTDIGRALFPCSSVTGAPKVRTMQIISELESTPRGIYTGCIGYAAPGRQMRFNVAIRTVQIDRRQNTAEYGTGAGIVWDSQPAQEYDECLTKALVLSSDPRPFQLLETILWGPVRGYFLLDHHMKRLADSAAYFGFTYRQEEVIRILQSTSQNLPHHPHRVRLLVGDDGKIEIEVGVVVPAASEIIRLELASKHVDSGNRFLYHKTTRRDVYDAARASQPDCDDVLLWNERGELTESTIANLVVRRHGIWVTPPVRCGLLNGVYRRHLLEIGWIREEVIRKDDLAHVKSIHLINSVRGWIEAKLS